MKENSLMDISKRFEAINTNEVFIKDVIPADLSVRDFTELLKTNVQNLQELNTYYTCALLEVETKFKVLNEQFSLQYDRNPIESVKTRIKSFESIVEKIVRKNLPVSLQSVEQNIFDVAGIRIICSFIDDIYLLADCLLAQDDITLVRKKDYIKEPKPNGYRGLHLIVEVPIFLQQGKKIMKVEVQLRTIAMDFWASLEHKLKYKKNRSADILEGLEAELLDCATKTNELDIKMQKIRQGIEENQ